MEPSSGWHLLGRQDHQPFLLEPAMPRDDTLTGVIVPTAGH